MSSDSWILFLCLSENEFDGQGGFKIFRASLEHDRTKGAARLMNAHTR